MPHVAVLNVSICIPSQGLKAAHVIQSGFTRIPVYSGVRQNITGVLYVKDLILIDPDDNTELGSVLAFRCVERHCNLLLRRDSPSLQIYGQSKIAAFIPCRGTNVTYVREDVKLDVVFKEFMSSANHMLLVQGALTGGPETDSAASVCGLITLEDVMEELIGVSPAPLSCIIYRAWPVRSQLTMRIKERQQNGGQ